MEHRGSIFSNDSINGFNSALYLASEFNADCESETWIPINESSDRRNSVFSNASRFFEEFESSSEGLKLSTNQSFSNNEIKSNLNPALSSEFKRRLSTPLNFREESYFLPFISHKKIDNDFSLKSLNNNNDSTQLSVGSKLIYSQGISNGDTNIYNDLSYPVDSFNRLETLNQNITNIMNQHTAMQGMILLNFIRGNNCLPPKNHDFISDVSKSCKKKGKKKHSQIREGDWICQSCQNLNFSFRFACNKCSFVKESESQT